MSNSIYRYHVSYDFCNQKTEREYKDLQNAVEDALTVLNQYGYSSEIEDSIHIKEVEYASERNLKNHFSLQTRYIWSNSFHGVEDLKVLAGENKEDGRRFTHNGKSTSMKEYAEIAKKRLKAEEKKNSYER